MISSLRRRSQPLLAALNVRGEISIYAAAVAARPATRERTSLLLVPRHLRQTTPTPSRAVLADQTALRANEPALERSERFFPLSLRQLELAAVVGQHREQLAELGLRVLGHSGVYSHAMAEARIPGLAASLES